MPQDWQLCKGNLISSWDLFNKEFHNAGVYLNLAREICAGQLHLLMPGHTTINIPAFTIFTLNLTLSMLLTHIFTLFLLSAFAPTTSTLPIPPMSMLPIPYTMFSTSISISHLTTPSLTLTTFAFIS